LCSLSGLARVIIVREYSAGTWRYYRYLKIFEGFEDLWRTGRFVKNWKIYEEFEGFPKFLIIFEISFFEIAMNFGEYMKNMQIFQDCWNFGEYLELFEECEDH
jgi:hypothetical protein